MIIFYMHPTLKIKIFSSFWYRPFLLLFSNNKFCLFSCIIRRNSLYLLEIKKIITSFRLLAKHSKNLWLRRSMRLWQKRVDIAVNFIPLEILYSYLYCTPSKFEMIRSPPDLTRTKIPSCAYRPYKP